MICNDFHKDRDMHNLGSVDMQLIPLYMYVYSSSNTSLTLLVYKLALVSAPLSQRH